MRLFLDTNIIAFLFTGQNDEICADVRSLLEDYANTLLTSSVCVTELIHLIQIGKLKDVKADAVVMWLSDIGIRIVSPTDNDLQTLSELPLVSDHRDPNDRLIISQSVCSRIPLISSDRKFSLYKRHGLQFIFNDR